MQHGVPKRHGGNLTSEVALLKNRLALQYLIMFCFLQGLTNSGSIRMNKKGNQDCLENDAGGN